MSAAGRRVVVVGGGLAGMAAVLRLAGAGCQVELVERRPFLGGRAFSFRDPDTGAVIDNGQHVLAGACRRLRAFLAEIGSPPGAFARQPRLRIPILDGRGRSASLSTSRLPAPLHLLPALLGYSHLQPRDRLRVARDVRALSRLAGRGALEDVPLGEWLAGRPASPEAIERFWGPLVTPALNMPVAEANLPLTAFFLDRAIWSGPEGGALWLPRVGLSEAIGEPGGRALAASGVVLRLGEKATSLAIDNGRIEGVVLSGGDALEADALGSAVESLPEADALGSAAESLPEAGAASDANPAHAPDGAEVATTPAPSAGVREADERVTPVRAHLYRTPDESHAIDDSTAVADLESVVAKTAELLTETTRTAAPSPAFEEEFILDIPPAAEESASSVKPDAEPAKAAVETAPSLVPGSPDWNAMAEEIRMQVLQRLDLFTDTGMRACCGR